MNNATNLKFRKIATVGRKETATSSEVNYALKEDDTQSNFVTSSARRTHTLQQNPNLQHSWSCKHILPLACVFIMGLFLAYFVKQNLDYRDQIVKLQLNNTECITNIQYLKEKVEELKTELVQTKKSLSDSFIEKDELRDKETQCRLDLGLMEAERRHDKELYETKEEYRLEMDQRRKGEQDNLEYENRFWREGTEWLLDCLGRQNINTAQGDFILSRAFRTIIRAIEGGLGINSDVENCLKMFNNRFQRRLSA